MLIAFRIVYFLLFILLAGCVGSSKNIDSNLQKENAKPFALSAKEKTWLASHPNIKLAPDPEFVPIEYFDENGNYRGIAADYLAHVEKNYESNSKLYV
jgi:hypothetical protein